MSQVITLEIFAHEMDRASKASVRADQIGRHMACVRLVAGIKNKFGEEHLLPPPLALSTQRRRARLGYDPRGTLLRRGDLRNSIKEFKHGDVMGVETDDPKAHFHEFGGHIPGRPPKRSFMASTARELDREIFAIYFLFYVRRMQGPGKLF